MKKVITYIYIYICNEIIASILVVGTKSDLKARRVAEADTLADQIQREGWQYFECYAGSATSPRPFQHVAQQVVLHYKQ